jgi:hypothetical protein
MPVLAGKSTEEVSPTIFWLCGKLRQAYARIREVGERGGRIAVINPKRQANVLLCHYLELQLI